MALSKHVHIFYTGHVQGVGFRYTFHKIASYLGAKGWVKNLPDGRVEARVEAEEIIIQKICDELKDVFQGHIINVVIHEEGLMKGLNDFRIIQ
jgi:acylphosphatase